MRPDDLIHLVTIGVITFRRPACLSNLLASAKARYPSLRVVVADDSGEDAENRDICSRNGATHVPCSHDCGIPTKRNVLVDIAETPYVLICDDDHEFGPRTSIEALLHALEVVPLDIASAVVVNEPGGKPTWGRGILFRWRGVLYCAPPFVRLKQPKDGVEFTDFAENFFLARTKVLRRVRWNERLKLQDHVEFFWTCKNLGVHVGQVQSVVAVHRSTRSEEYAGFIGRNPEWRRRMLELIGVREFVRLKTSRDFDGAKPSGVRWKDWIRGDEPLTSSPPWRQNPAG